MPREFLDRPVPERFTFWAMFQPQIHNFIPAWAMSVAAHVLLVAVAAILLFTPKSPEQQRLEEAVRAVPLRPGAGPPKFTPEGHLPHLPRNIGTIPEGGGIDEGPSRGEGRDFAPRSRLSTLSHLTRSASGISEE